VEGTGSMALSGRRGKFDKEHSQSLQASCKLKVALCFREARRVASSSLENKTPVRRVVLEDIL
jgi:hypothetical protein